MEDYSLDIRRYVTACLNEDSASPHEPHNTIGTP
jgi:hypothetical protein